MHNVETLVIQSPSRMTRQRPVVIAVPESDCHVVALKLLERYLETLGYPVVNLGVTTSNSEIADAVAEWQPVAVLISAQNGHALSDLRGLQEELHHRSCSAPLFIGGKVTVGAVEDWTAISNEFQAIGFEILHTFDQAQNALLRLSAGAKVHYLAEAVQ